jgi:hypothetical protein
MLGILFWVLYFLMLLGGTGYSWRIYAATAPYFPGVIFGIMLLVGALGIKVFPISW